MATGDWAKLVERYAGGRPLCNCRQAYYATDGEYMISGDDGRVHHDGNYCKYGCQANQYNLKDEIAEKVLKELNH